MGVFLEKHRSAYLEIPHNDNLVFNDSVGIEVVFRGVGAVGTLTDIVDKRDNAFVAGGKGFTLRTRSNNTKLEFAIGGDLTNISSIVDISEGETEHAFVQYSRSRSTLEIYLNGSYVGGTTGDVGDFNTTTPLRVGQLAYGSGENYNGWLKYVRVYKDVWMTQDDVMAMYNGQKITNGLVADFEFKKSWGFFERELVTNQRVRLNNTRWSVRKHYGLRFLGSSNSYVLVNENVSLALTGKFTVCVLWKRMGRIVSTSNNQWLIGKYTFKVGGWLIATAENGDVVRFYRTDPAGVYYITASTTLSELEGDFHLIGITYENGIGSIWVDGVMESSGSLPDAEAITECYIGRYSKDIVGAAWIWKDYVLSQIEMEQLYDNPDDPPARQNLVLWYRFNRGHGSRVEDMSGNGNYGTIRNARWV